MLTYTIANISALCSESSLSGLDSWPAIQHTEMIPNNMSEVPDRSPRWVHNLEKFLFSIAANLSK